jgi:hypothetical protein
MQNHIAAPLTDFEEALFEAVGHERALHVLLVKVG